MAAKGIQDICNGVGLIYITDITGLVSGMIANLPNDANGLNAARVDGLVVSPLTGTLLPTGKVIITTAVGVGDTITAVNINGVNQTDGVGVPIIAGDEEQTAQDLRDAINSYTPGVGEDYSAVSNGSDVVLIPYNIVDPTSVNGHTVAIVFSGASTITSEDIGGGQNGDGLIDPVKGHRYFLNAGYGATGCSGEAPAIPGDLTFSREITQYIVMQGLQQKLPVDIQNLLAEDTLTLPRTTALQWAYLEGQGSVADDLSIIDITGFVDGDILMLRSFDIGEPITIVDNTALGDNVYLLAMEDYLMDSNAKAMMLQFRSESVGSSVGFYEIARTDSVIPSASITGMQIALLTILGANIADGTIGNIKISDLDASKLTGILPLVTIPDGTLPGTKLVGLSVSADKRVDDLNFLDYTIPISAETAGELDEYVHSISLKCEVVLVQAVVVKDIEATDDLTIQMKNNAGVNMTGGLITIPAGTTFGTIVSVIPTAFNTFVTGEFARADANKVTPGGKVQLFLTIHRLP